MVVRFAPVSCAWRREYGRLARVVINDNYVFATVDHRAGRNLFWKEMLRAVEGRLISPVASRAYPVWVCVYAGIGEN